MQCSVEKSFSRETIELKIKIEAFTKNILNTTKNNEQRKFYINTNNTNVHFYNNQLDNFIHNIVMSTLRYAIHYITSSLQPKIHTPALYSNDLASELPFHIKWRKHH
jgi:hypothetical protein